MHAMNVHACVSLLLLPFLSCVSVYHSLSLSHPESYGFIFDCPLSFLLSRLIDCSDYGGLVYCIVCSVLYSHQVLTSTAAANAPLQLIMTYTLYYVTMPDSHLLLRRLSKCTWTSCTSTCMCSHNRLISQLHQFQ